MKMLKDSFGRTFPYIRLSITDVCNFKCGYCLPNGYQKDKSDNRTFLAIEEIERLAKGLSELGVCKIRLTGGEPTVRKDFFDIIKILKSNSGIKKTVITTNGYRLDKIASQIVDSGLDGINISIDSLNRETFKNITSHDRLPEILRGIEKLQQLNFKNIKINAVLLKGINDNEKDFNEWSNFIKNNEIDFRYIELMQTGDGLDYFKKYNDTYGHKAGDEVLVKVSKILTNDMRRDSDYAFRVGGEEFACLLLARNEERVFAFIEKVRQDIEETQLVTASFGVCIIDNFEYGDFDEMYRVADKFLYEAKDNGRNQVVGGIVKLKPNITSNS